jgi:EAL domain-containing protein (putative c-di-GMP-specific phosphodiesterase class I)
MSAAYFYSRRSRRSAFSTLKRAAVEGIDVLNDDQSSGSVVSPQPRADILRAAFEDGPVGIGVCDEDGRFVAVNQSLAGLLGLSVQAIVGRPFLTFIHPEDRGASLACYFNAVVQAAAGAAAVSASARELRCIRGDLSMTWTDVSWTVTAPDAFGHQYGITHLVDVAGKRAVELEPAALEQRFGVGADPVSGRSLGGRTLVAELRQAIVTGTLDLVYQPMIDLATDRIAGVEALCRWRHPRLGPIDPTEFIAVAERSGLIEPLTRWVLMKACRYGAAWRAQLPCYADLDIAVNISAGSLRDPGFNSTVSDCLAESGLPATNLILEITETTLAVADPVLLEKAHGLRDLGVRLSLDDFGTGHSSLARLSQLPLAMLKLDRSRIAQITDHTALGPLVRATVAMAEGLGLTLIAEGLETPAQLAQLRSVGCPRGQGNLLAPPQPAEDLLRMLYAEQARHAT